MYGFSEASTSRGRGTANRLKPPPYTINFECKKIKLSSSSLRSDDLESIQIKRLKKFEKPSTNGDILDRIIIKDRRKEKEKKTKSETQSIIHEPTDDGSTNTAPEQSKSQGSESHSREKESGSRRIKLKRSYSSSSSEVKCMAVVNIAVSNGHMYHKTLILCFSGDYLNVPKIRENAKCVRVKENEGLYMYITHISTR